MPYSTNADLPEGVKGLPDHAQDIFRAAYNSAEEKYKGSANDARRAKIAWAAVKSAGYTQDSKGKWQAPKAKSDGVTKLEKAAPNVNPPPIFIPIIKIDEARHEVYGYASVEEPDHSGEILDYATSKPYFERWSQAAQKRSGGKSLGNVRAMHRNIAAGKLIQFTADDQKKAFAVGAQIVDENEWHKVESGVYTGFSVGGSYVKRWPDANPALIRFTADPNELSIVDAPCVPSSTFYDVVKADGTHEQRAFSEEHSNTALSLFKGVSLDDLSQAIRGAWYERFQPHDSSEQMAQPSSEWVTEIFTDAVITCDEGKYYRYPYAKVSDDEIQFTGEKQEVEQMWIPKGVESSLPSSSLSSITSSPSSLSMPSMPLMPDMGKAQITINSSGIHINKQAQPNITNIPDAGDEPLLPLDVARQPIDRAANPFNPTPIDPYSAAPPASELIAHGDPAQSVVEATDQIALASNPKFGKEDQPASNAAAAVSKLKVRKKGVKIMANKPAPAAEPAPAAAPPIVQKDAQSVLQSAQSLIADIKSQASKEGQIDQDKLDQLAAALQVTVDQVGDHSSELESKTKSTASELGTTTASNPISSSATTPASSSSSDDHTPSSMESSMSKSDNPPTQEPFTTTPPRAALEILTGGDAVQAIVPQMIEALARNQLSKARALCSEDLGNGVRKFNEPMFNDAVMMSLHTVADQLGFTQRNYPTLLRKLGQFTGSGDDEDLGNGLKKAITASGIPGINLLPLARLMLPVYSGLGRRLPLTQPKTGSDKATWRTQIGFGSFDEVAAMSVAESAIGSAMGESFLTFETSYKDTTVNDKASLKSLAASRGYDDPLQVATINALAAILRVRERNLLGSNAAALADPASVTGTPGGSGSLGNSDDKFTVTALTYRGWLNWLTTGKVGTDGTLVPIGETVGTTTSAVNLSAAANVTITWPIVKGAVAYAVYYLPHGVVANGHVIGVFLPNTTGALTTSAVPGSGNKAPTADTSVNANGYEGLVSWCELTSIYSNTVSTSRTLIDNAGAGLTTGNGGITQFNTALRQLWTNWQIAPTLMIMSPQMVQTTTAKLLALNNAALYRIEVQQERGTITGGAFVTSIVNQFAPMIDGSPRSVEIMGHPYFPDGTVLIVSETVPYALSRTANAFQAEQLVPFTYFPLAQTTLDYPFAVTLSEVLECFHPAAEAAICGIDVSL